MTPDVVAEQAEGFRGSYGLGHLVGFRELDERGSPLLSVGDSHADLIRFRSGELFRHSSAIDEWPELLTGLEGVLSDQLNVRVVDALFEVGRMTFDVCDDLAPEGE